MSPASSSPSDDNHRSGLTPGKSVEPPSAIIDHAKAEIENAPDAGRRNGEREDADGSAVLHRSLHALPKRVVSASGIYLTLADGSRILDATGGAAVACVGHSNAAVKQAMIDQVDTVSYCHSLFYATPAAEDLARSLVESTGGTMARLFIVSSGSEAMEAAAKMARQYFLELSPPQPERVRFIARRQSYHGTTLGALAIGGHVARRKLYEPMLAPIVSHVSPCYAYRGWGMARRRRRTWRGWRRSSTRSSGGSGQRLCARLSPSQSSVM